MAKKRFADTEIWNKEWFMDLTPRLKCLVRYLFDSCDPSGVWSPNWKLASLHIGEAVEIGDVVSLPDTLVEVLPNGKIFLPGFIDFQYGQLSENSPAHKPVFLAITKNGLGTRVFNRVSNTLQEKDKVKEEEKETVKEEETAKETKGGAGGKFLVPEMFRVFKSQNKNYPGSVERDYKPLYSIAQFIAHQGNATGPPEAHTDRILEAWEPISAWISQDGFYSQKSLSTCSNHIQEITTKAIHGDKSTTKKTSGNGLNIESIKRKATEHTRSW